MNSFEHLSSKILILNLNSKYPNFEKKSQTHYLQNGVSGGTAGFISNDALIDAFVRLAGSVDHQTLIRVDGDVTPSGRRQSDCIFKPRDGWSRSPFSFAPQHFRLSPEHFAGDIRHRRGEYSREAVDDEICLSSISAGMRRLVNHSRDAGVYSPIVFDDVVDNERSSVSRDFVFVEIGRQRDAVFRPIIAKQTKRVRVGNAVERGGPADFDNGVGGWDHDLRRDEFEIIR